jgi:predicted oxidoreductase
MRPFYVLPQKKYVVKENRMASIKKSVRLTDATIETCKALSDAGDVNWSGSINAMAEQYQLLIKEAMPEMQENQWNAIYCCFNGYAPHPDINQEINMLPWHIEQGCEFDDQVRDFLGDEQQSKLFIETIKQMSPSQRLAIIYKARTYWSKC